MIEQSRIAGLDITCQSLLCTLAPPKHPQAPPPILSHRVTGFVDGWRKQGRFTAF